MKRVTAKFVPRECTYRVWWIHLDKKPRGAKVLYWEVNEDDEYCGVLMYRVDIMRTIAVSLVLYTLYCVLIKSSYNSSVVECPKIVYLNDDKLSLNVNSKSLNPIRCDLLYDGRIIHSVNLDSGRSVGTVSTKVKLKDGDYPAILRFVDIDSRGNEVIEEVVVLLEVN